jgi:hypothetical protein
LSHGDTVGVTSFLLTTETVRSGEGGGKHGEEKEKTSTEVASPSDPDGRLLKQLKEVRESEDEQRYCCHQLIARHAVKGTL